MHNAQLMPLPLTISCFSKIQIGFTFLVPAHPGSPGERAVKRACVCMGKLSGVVSRADMFRDPDQRQKPLGHILAAKQTELQLNYMTSTMHCFATITSSSSHYHHHWTTAQPLTDSLTDATYMYTQTGSRQCRFRAGGVGVGGAQAPPNRGYAPTFSRTLDTLWSIDSRNN